MEPIPKYALQAYAFLYDNYKTKTAFTQKSLESFFSISMRKKVFSLLVRKGWIIKKDKIHYKCNKPEVIFKNISTGFQKKR